MGRLGQANGYRVQGCGLQVTCESIWQAKLNGNAHRSSNESNQKNQTIRQSKTCLGKCWVARKGSDGNLCDWRSARASGY